MCTSKWQVLYESTYVKYLEQAKSETETRGYQHFPGGSDGKESACNAVNPGFDPWVRKIPWRREWQPTPVFLLEHPMDRGAWWATVPGVAKSWMWPSKEHFSLLHFQGLGRRKRELLLNGHRAPVSGDNVLEMDGGDGCTALWMQLMTLRYAL